MREPAIAAPSVAVKSRLFMRANIALPAVPRRAAHGPGAFYGARPASGGMTIRCSGRAAAVRNCTVS